MRKEIRVLTGLLILFFSALSTGLTSEAEAGMTAGPKADIYIGPNNQELSAMAYDSTNKRFLVVWESGDVPGDSNVYGQLVNADGSLYGSRMTISTAEGLQYSAKVAFDSVNKRFLVVWADGRNFWGSPQRRVSAVYGQFINTDGSFDNNNFAITYLPSDPYSYEPGNASPRGVIFDPTLNRFFLLTIQCQNITYDYYHDHNLYGQFLNTDGSLSGGYFPITDPNGPISPYFYISVLEYDTNQGRFLIAYSRYSHQFLGRLLNVDGSFYGNEFIIPNVSPPDRQNGMTSLAFDSSNNRFLLLWNSAAYGDTIYGQLINADGSLSGSEIAISPPVDYATNGSAIFDDASRKFFLVGSAYPSKIFGQLLNPDGSLSGPVFDINIDDLSTPFLVGGSSEYLVAWSADSGAGTGRDVYGKAVRVLDDYILYMPEMTWDIVEASHNSTGAAAAQMILNYIREGAQVSWLAETTIYTYAKGEAALSGDLTPEEMAKALGHFDPYDSLISNWSDRYDTLPEGNPYKGYNFSIDSYDPNSDADALNNYMRDICHWMAYTVTKEDWWLDGELAARPNTPAAIPIFGTYNHWVAVNGFSASANPAPQPHTNPWDLPDFTVNAFWIKDPMINGIGQNAYKTAAECALTYFLPLSTGDSFNGKFVQIAEPPPEISRARVEIAVPREDKGNLEFAGIKTTSSSSGALAAQSDDQNGIINTNPFIKKRDWFDILPAHLLSDYECYAAFNGAKKGEPVLVKRADLENSAYLLLPFNKPDKKGRALTSAVIILDAEAGYFKEASWTKEPEKFLKVNENDARRMVTYFLVRDLSKKLNKLPKLSITELIKQRNMLYKNTRNLIASVREGSAQLYWKPGSPYSLSPYRPLWKIEADGYVWYVTQDGKVISDF